MAPTTAVTARTWRNLVVAHSVVLAKMEADLQESAGLTLAQYDVLLRLHEAPGSALRMGDLAAQVLVTTSGVTRVVDRLVAAGLLERTRGDADRRVVTVAITEEGDRVLRIASRIHNTGIEDYFTRLIDPTELSAIDAFFGRLVAEHTDPGERRDLGLPLPPPQIR